MPPVPARERGGREVLRGVRRAAGPGVRQVRSDTVSDREVLPRVCASTGSSAAPPPAQRFDSPESYTPKHLAEKILTSKSALEGERKQVTVLFVDVSGSTALSPRPDPEERPS